MALTDYPSYIFALLVLFGGVIGYAKKGEVFFSNSPGSKIFWKGINIFYFYILVLELQFLK